MRQIDHSLPAANAVHFLALERNSASKGWHAGAKPGNKPCQKLIGSFRQARDPYGRRFIGLFQINGCIHERKPGKEHIAGKARMTANGQDAARGETGPGFRIIVPVRLSVLVLGVVIAKVLHR